MEGHHIFLYSAIAYGDLLHSATIRVTVPEDGVYHTETRRRNAVNILLYEPIHRSIQNIPY
jgi:hypothetical protein